MGDEMNSKRDIGRMGIVALTVGITAVCLTPSMAHSADSDLSGPQATASSAMSPEVAACIKHGTDMPEIKNAVILFPGKKHDQTAEVITHSEAQAPECIGETTRKIKGKVQVAKWSSHHRKYWKTIGSDLMYRDFPDGSYSDLGLGRLSVEPGGHNGLAKSQLVTCLPGPRKRPVRALIERNVTYKATGKTYRKASPISIKVQGGGC